MEADVQVSQLEQALQQQAGTLARELLQNAESACARMLAESAEKLKLAGEHEVLGAKVEAERLVRRQGQAAETRLAAELDRLRWALTESALAEVKIAFRHLVQDETRYLDVLEAWLAAAAQALPPGDLPELLERPLELLHGLQRPLHLQFAAAVDRLHAQSVAQGAEVRVARAEEDHRFLAVLDGQRASHQRISHEEPRKGFTAGNAESAEVRQFTLPEMHHTRHSSACSAFPAVKD